MEKWRKELLEVKNNFCVLCGMVSYKDVLGNLFVDFVFLLFDGQLLPKEGFRGFFTASLPFLEFW